MNSLLEYYRKKEDTDTNSIIFEQVKEEDIKICGKSLKEVITILQGLDLERTLDIQMTMKNLDMLFKELTKRDEEAYQKWLKNQFN